MRNGERKNALAHQVEYNLPRLIQMQCEINDDEARNNGAWLIEMCAEK